MAYDSMSNDGRLDPRHKSNNTEEYSRQQGGGNAKRGSGGSAQYEPNYPSGGSNQAPDGGARPHPTDPVINRDPYQQLTAKCDYCGGTTTNTTHICDDCGSPKAIVPKRNQEGYEAASLENANKTPGYDAPKDSGRRNT
jgi:hypothetical protein